MMRHRIALQGWLFGDRLLGAPSGAKNRLASLLVGLAELPEARDYDITLLTGRDPDPDLDDAVRALPHGNVCRMDLCAAPTLARVRREVRILDRATREFDLLELASLPHPRLTVRTALLVHDVRDTGTFARSVVHRLCVRRALRNALHRCTVAIAPSEEVARRLRSIVDTRVEIVPAGIRVPPAQTWPQVTRVPPGALISLARCEARKDLPFLVRAYAAARRLRQGVLPPLVFVGPESDGWRAVSALARELDIAPHVHFVHDVRDGERWPILASAKALCFPTRLEGFGLPALEAALVGCPVLVRAGSVPHAILGDASIPVGNDADNEPKNVEDWSRAIADVAESEVAREGAANARPRLTECYSPERAARAWICAWERALASSSRAVG
ncbi:MAG: glycosyltransferase [Planctomycetes bacterium]|nr:glycosyltransferase [Planctomycetota bacterium]